MSKTLKWLVLGCAVVFPVVVGVGLWQYNHRTDVMLRRELARIAAQGSPMTMADIAGKDIVDSVNGAPEYHRAIVLVSTEEAYKDIGYTIGSVLSYRQPGEPEVDWVRVRAVVAKYGEAVRLVEEAQKKPMCRFSLDWSMGPYAVLYEDAAKIRTLSRAVSGAAELYAKDGKLAEALRTALVACKMEEALKDPPTTINTLVRCACLAISLHTVSDILAYGDVPERDALRLCDQLAKIDLPTAFEQGLKLDRAMGICGCNQVREAGPEYYYPGDTRPETAEKFYRQCDEDELYFLTQMRGQLDVFKMSYRDAVLQKRDIGEPKGAPAGAKISSAIPGIGRLMKTRDRAIATIDGTRIALALAVYHGRHKSYPTSLDEVATILGGKVPVDPFSAKSFVYKRQGQGYLLYSIGPDLKDDGGKPAQGGNVGDLVWTGK